MFVWLRWLVFVICFIGLWIVAFRGLIWCCCFYDVVGCLLVFVCGIVWLAFRGVWFWLCLMFIWVEFWLFRYRGWFCVFVDWFALCFNLGFDGFCLRLLWWVGVLSLTCFVLLLFDCLDGWLGLRLFGFVLGELLVVLILVRLVVLICWFDLILLY